MAAVPEYRGRVLVVDDERPVRQLLAQVLQQEGYYVQQADGFAQVQQRLAEESFDLVTLDIAMPEVDGLEMLSYLRQQVPDTGVVMATALGEVGTVIAAMRQGAYSYILKPFELGLVEAEVARAMERQRLVAQNREYQRDLEAKVAEQTRALRQAYARLERQVRELEGRDRLTRIQMEGTALQESGELLQTFHHVLGVEQAALYRPGTAGRGLELVAALGLGPGAQTGSGYELAERAFQNRQPQDQGEEGAAVPLLHQEEVLGVLWAKLPQGGGESREEWLNTLWRLGQQAALALWAAQVSQELEKGGAPVADLLELE